MIKWMLSKIIYFFLLKIDNYKIKIRYKKLLN